METKRWDDWPNQLMKIDSGRSSQKQKPWPTRSLSSFWSFYAACFAKQSLTLQESKKGFECTSAVDAGVSARGNDHCNEIAIWHSPDSQCMSHIQPCVAWQHDPHEASPPPCDKESATTTAKLGTMAAVMQPLGAMQAELQRLQLLTNDIPTMKMDLDP